MAPLRRAANFDPFLPNFAIWQPWYQTTITLFREDEYGRVGEAGYSAQRSYTGQVGDLT